jgi:hypothetical protein
MPELQSAPAVPAPPRPRVSLDAEAWVLAERVIVAQRYSEVAGLAQLIQQTGGAIPIPQA